MGFFSSFTQWLNALLAQYIDEQAVRVAEALEPAVVTLGVLYVVIWGLLQIFGRIEEPLLDGLKRLAILALIFGLGLHMWLYHELLVDTFFDAPTQLGRAIIGAYDPVTIVDTITFQASDVAELLFKKGALFNKDIAYYLAGAVVYLVLGATAIYTMFLLALSRIALSILLALGPLFIALLFFESTRRFMEAWLAQLANYALLAVLTVLVAALMLTMLGDAARAAAETGGGIKIVDAVRVCLAAGLTFLVMAQIPSMAAGLASGIALSSLGIAGGLAGGAFGKLGQFARGAFMDRESSRWDSLSRKGGFYAGKAAWTAAKAPFVLPLYLRQRMRRNTVRGRPA